MMTVALGFLVAILGVIVIAPAYRRRVVRLTTDAIRQSIPITEAEIRADKDRMRAQFAIRIHKLEAENEQQRLMAARQLIDMNRKDARITEINTEMEAIRAALEEHVNARRVLEHTVTDRLPRLEQQLESARGLINARDQEMHALKSETTRSVRALDEAMQMNAQQRSEMERIASSLSSRKPASREAAPAARFEGEIALRSEIEALRAKAREQAQLIARLETAAGGTPALSGAGGSSVASAIAAVSAAAAGPAATGEVERLRHELSAARATLEAARNAPAMDSREKASYDARVEELRSKVEDQTAEIARLKAGLAAYEGDGEGQRPNVIRDSRLGAKSKISSLQAQIAAQNETIARLRSELAANNERLARQSALHMEEMRRLGSGTVPTSVDPRRTKEPQPRRALSDRIGGAGPAGNAAPRAPTSAKVAEYLKALTDEAPQPPAGEDDGATTGALQPAPAPAEPAVALAAAANSDAPPTDRKSRLLDRISGLNKS